MSRKELYRAQISRENNEKCTISFYRAQYSHFLSRIMSVGRDGREAPKMLMQFGPAREVRLGALSRITAIARMPRFFPRNIQTYVMLSDSSGDNNSQFHTSLSLSLYCRSKEIGARIKESPNPVCFFWLHKRRRRREIIWFRLIHCCSCEKLVSFFSPL